MNRYYRYTLVLLILFISACGQKKEAAPTEPTKDTPDGVPMISAVEAEHDFGRVKQGAKVSHVYKIKNVGAKELVIEKTRGS